MTTETKYPPFQRAVHQFIEQEHHLGNCTRTYGQLTHAVLSAAIDVDELAAIIQTGLDANLPPRLIAQGIANRLKGEA